MAKISASQYWYNSVCVNKKSLCTLLCSYLPIYWSSFFKLVTKHLRRLIINYINGRLKVTQHETPVRHQISDFSNKCSCFILFYLFFWAKLALLFYSVLKGLLWPDKINVFVVTNHLTFFWLIFFLKRTFLAIAKYS